MHAHDIGDIIARFIGSFEIATDGDRLRQSYEDFLAARAKDVSFKDAGTHAIKAPGLSGGAPHNPDIDLAPSGFAIEHGRSHALHPQDIEIAIPGLVRLHHTVRHGHDEDVDGFASGSKSAIASSGIASRGHVGAHREVVLPDGEVAYHEGDGSTLVSIRQDGTLLDDDVFSVFGDRQPTPTPESFAAELDTLIAEAEAWSRSPEPTNDIAALKSMLTVAASGEAEEEPGEVAPGGGLAEHAGLYVNGQAGGIAPDLVEILKAHFEAEPKDDAASGIGPSGGASEGAHVATVSLGDNLLLNQTIIVEAATYGHTSVVLGDWHEVNVIRQLNIVADRDVVVETGFGGFTAGGTQTFSAAHFERLDPGATDPGDDARAFTAVFPRSYTVDVVEGDLLVSNFIRQIHKVSDNDGALFTSVSHDVSIVMGGNEALHFATLSQLTLGYDLVIFGGSVFEGNFIEQINLLLDHDRIGGDGVFAQGTSGETGGNLLYNNATIRTIGANDAFDDVDPAIRDLVAQFDEGAGTIASSLSSDLAFLGATHLKVLYITGDYVEINVISQLNILSDADTAGYVDALIGELTSDEAVWTVSTGGNILVNDATILDADAGGPRQLAGEYYSDSILIQADLVSSGDGIEVFDTGKLANELIAFTSNDATDDDAGHHPAAVSYDAPIDGVGGILS